VQIIILNQGGYMKSIIGILWAIAPLYAAYHDFQNGNWILALADYIFFPLGLIRSIMFLFG